MPLIIILDFVRWIVLLLKYKLKTKIMKVTDKIEITNEDNMELMARYPDNYFDLAIVDPPYGIGMDGNNNWSGSKHEVKDWDNDTPSKEYFNELMRISKNQIVWGANHFISRMPYDSKCWLIWDKKNDGFSFADGEMAWTSFDTAVRFFRYHRGQQTDKRIHPTQKPVKLYEWLFINSAKEGDKILDTHLGSGSIAIACHNLGFELTACELDKEYYDNAIKRIKNHTAQLRIM
jgi:site-specific DNA-methyltransferase (adenine-specific)